MESDSRDNTLQIKEEHLENLYKFAIKIKDNEEEYFMILERLLYLLLELLKTNPTPSLTFDPLSLLNEFVDVFNKKAVESFEGQNLEQAHKEISRVFDILHQDNILAIYKENEKLLEAQILTYNNLSCIFRKGANLTKSLMVLNHACAMEEKLVKHNYGSSAVSIISTYLNKCAILSEMKRHAEAIEAAKTAMEHIQAALVNKSLGADQLSEARYFEMLCNYNLGAEYDHLRQKEKASYYYNKSLTLAKEIKNENFITQLQNALRNLK